MPARVTQAALLVAYSSGVPGELVMRAWTFVLDGHTFYVLGLGEEGTFAYDTVTSEWFKVETGGYGVWNMFRGRDWNGRTVAADVVSPVVWALDPDAPVDEGWRDIDHVVSGGVTTRSRVHVGCDAVRLAACAKDIDLPDGADIDGATVRLRFTDDNGATWSAYRTVQLAAGDSGAKEIAWRSLGSFAAPGRFFEISDTGGLLRIDGCDAFLNGFDGEESTGD